METVIDQRQLLERLFSAMNAASLVAVSIAGVMIVCAILLIATTIRLSAFSRRRETGIMRLVGASKMVIQLPFILEGVIAAVIGAALASGTLWAVAHFFLGEFLSKQYPDTAFISPGQTLILAPALIGPGRSPGRNFLAADPPPIPEGLGCANRTGNAYDTDDCTALRPVTRSRPANPRLADAAAG